MPGLGVLDELVVLGRVAPLVARAQQVGLPFDVDLITEMGFELLDTNRADVTPRSKKVGPDGELDRIGRRNGHGDDRRLWAPMVPDGQDSFEQNRLRPKGERSR